MPSTSRHTKTGISKWGPIVIGLLALATAAMGLVREWIKVPVDDRPKPSPTATVAHTPTPKPVPGLGGRLEGAVVNRTEAPISNLTVKIQGGPETKTDALGIFVLNGVPSGDQIIVVENSSAPSGQLLQHINIAPSQTTQTKIIYDAQTSRLGLLAIAAPVDDSELEVYRDGARYRATLYGRCDGLALMVGAFDVWVVIKSQTDDRYWVQHPSATRDVNAQTWRADVLLGDFKHQPRPGERWTFVALAAETGSLISKIASTPSLNQLPPHISSNVVTARIRIR
jgi:hypothetical protein